MPLPLFPQPHRHPASPGASRREGEPQTGGRLPESYLVVGILLILTMLFAAEVPQVDATLRVILIQSGTALSLLLLAFCARFSDDMRVALRRAPNLLLLLLLAWSVFCFFENPFRGYAAVDLSRMVAGVATYFLAAYALPGQRQIVAVVVGVLALGCLMSLVDFAHLGQAQGGVRVGGERNDGFFGTHENVGSLLAMLVPFALAFAVSEDTEEKARLAALAAALILGSALLLARTRSAWIGSVIALLILCALWLRYRTASNSQSANDRPWQGRQRRSGGRKRNGPAAFFGSPIFLIGVGFAILITVGNVAPALTHRAATLQNTLGDNSFEIRLLKWSAAARMASEKPLTGWGLGSFVVMQGKWTHDGDDIAEVLTHGTAHQNTAHDFYLHWAAETGLVGLTLYVAVLAAFLVAAFRALPDATASPFRRTLLIAAIACICGSAVDAIGSPAYTFHGITTMFWFWMGIGVAAMRPTDRRGTPTGVPALGPATVTSWAISLGAGMLASVIVLTIGLRLRGMGPFPLTLPPPGHLRVTSSPIGPVAPGTPVLWTATFTDSNGKRLSTMPGTAWDIAADDLVLRSAPVDMVRQRVSPDQPDLYDSGLRIRIPSTTTPVGVTAIYYDQYGREYDARTRVEVQASR